MGKGLRTKTDQDGGSSMEKLTVLVESSVMNQLYIIQGREGFKNISELTRIALAAYIDNYNNRGRSDIISYKPAPAVLDSLHDLVDLGEFNEVEDAVSYALRKYVEEYKKQYLQEVKEYEEMVEKRKRKLESEVTV